VVKEKQRIADAAKAVYTEAVKSAKGFSLGAGSREPNNTRTFFQQTAAGSKKPDGPLDTGTQILQYAIPAIISFAACTDGLSNTIIMSERVTAPDRYLFAVGDGTNRTPREETSILGGILVDGATSWQNPQMIMSAVMGKRYIRGPSFAGQGTFFGFYGQCFARFQTVLPPNSPSCTYRGGYELHIDTSLLPPTSYHPGGVNCSMADGSVRFISENIQQSFGTVPDSDPDYGGQIWSGNAMKKAITAYTGKSAFGVWGSLGSINGGESVAVP